MDGAGLTPGLQVGTAVAGAAVVGASREGRRFDGSLSWSVGMTGWFGGTTSRSVDVGGAGTPGGGGGAEVVFGTPGGGAGAEVVPAELVVA